MSDDQAYAKLGENSLSTGGRWMLGPARGLSREQEERRATNEYTYKVAEAYRWAHDQGQTMPPGLDKNGNEVQDLLGRYGEWRKTSIFADQDREREAARKKIKSEFDADGNRTPEAQAYVDLCMQQVRTNLQIFAARNKLPQRRA